MKSFSKYRKTSGLMLIALLLSASAVFSQASVRGNKNVTTVEHKVDNFSALEFSGAFKVVLSKSDSIKVKVETDENLHQQVSLRVHDGRLMIGSKGMINPTKLNVYVYYNELVAANISGAATLNSAGPIEGEEFMLNVTGAAKSDLQMNVEQLITKISGAAKVTLDGKATTHITEVSGAGELLAVKLVTEVTRAKVSGAAKATVTAIEKIDPDVSGAARLEYFDGTSMVSVGKEVQVSIHATEEINIDSLPFAELKSLDNNDSVHLRIGNLDIAIYDNEQARIKLGPNKLEMDGSGKVEFKKEPEKERFNGHWAGVNLGINGYVTPYNCIELPQEYSFLDLRYEKSINVQVNFYEQNFNIVANRLGLTTGLGIEWNNYRFHNDVKLDHNAPFVAEVPELNRNYTKSKLNVKYLNIPLILEFQTNPKRDINSFHIGAGVVGGLRIGSHTKNVHDDSKRQKEKVRDDFHLHPFKADVTLRIGWSKVNLYGNYSLLTLFRKEKGPELHPFSVGLTLLAF